MPNFVEAAPWDSQQALLDIKPKDVPNVIYKVHMYAPLPFTQQNPVNNGEEHKRRPLLAYPGTIAGIRYDREPLPRILQPVRDFQLAYHVHIYVGEFSAPRFAPATEKYLEPCIAL